MTRHDTPMTGHDTPIDEMPIKSRFLRGEIVFEEGPPSFAKASVHIFLEDTTLADAPARVIVHHLIENVSADTVWKENMPFALDVTIPDTQARYTVRVLVDVDGDGKISHGDYASTADYPVLTRGYPDQVVVHVKRIR
jgi:uncharacterized lipoprotein YbaY